MKDATAYRVFICANCSLEFTRLISRMKRAKRPFCSQSCAASFIAPLEERFWARVQKTDGCWLWTGQKSEMGHGRLEDKMNGRQVLIAHRISWELHFGPVPDGLCVLHDCDNPPCVNPSHLFLGTRTDNSDDKVSKNRQAKGVAFPQARLTDELVRELRQRRLSGATCYQLARETGISRSVISRAVNGVTWRHVQ